jgi:hypothetical protein
LGIPLQKSKTEHVENRSIGKDKTSDRAGFGGIFEVRSAYVGEESHRVLDFGEFVKKMRRVTGGAQGGAITGILHGSMQQTINAIRLRVKTVVTQLMPDVENDEKAASQSNRQPGNIDEGISLVLDQIPDRDSEIIFEHGSPSLVLSAWRTVGKMALAFVIIQVALNFVINVEKF